MKLHLTFEIADGKKLVTFLGATFLPFGANFGENLGNFFQNSRLFSETSFSRKAVLIDFN